MGDLLVITCCGVWLLAAVPAAVGVGRVCGLYQRCRYVDDLMREYQEEVDDA